MDILLTLQEHHQVFNIELSAGSDFCYCHPNSTKVSILGYPDIVYIHIYLCPQPE